MSQRSILFKGPLFEKVVTGDKTKTRRIVNLPKWAEPGTLEITEHGLEAVTKKTGCAAVIPCPYGTTGDLLHCGEPLEPFEDGELVLSRYVRDGATVLDGDKPVKWRWNLDADGKPQRLKSGEWWKLNSMFTPLEYRRVWLRVLKTWHERLHDISVEDIRAEGVELKWVKLTKNSRPRVCWRTGGPYKPEAKLQRDFTARDYWMGEWAHLWDSINKRRAPWGSNPWLWAVEFELLSTTGKPETTASG